MLEELRDLRLEMRADRRQAQADRRQAHADRRQARADRRQAQADRRQARAEWRQAEADRRQAEADRRRSDERFEQFVREFREDSARREAATQKALAGIQQAFRDVRTVGLAIVKTLNRHTRILEHHTVILERIDRKLGAPRQDGRGG